MLMSTSERCFWSGFVGHFVVGWDLMANQVHTSAAWLVCCSKLLVRTR